MSTGPAAAASSTALRHEQPPLTGWVSYLASVLLHLGIWVLVAWAWKSAPQGTGLEPTRSVGVVLKQENSATGQSEYLDEPSESDAASTSSSAAESAASSSSFLDDTPPSDPAAALPQAGDVLGLGNPEGSGLSGVPGMLQGTSQARAPGKGRARLQVFGIPAEGYKFIYVFDRSASMAGSSSRSPLNRAKAELLASLESLGDIHQFQIVFYNDKPSVFALAGQPGKLVFATEANKNQARSFVRGIVADGGTQHEPALLEALKMAPDVIYFLTDADQPAMSASQLERLQQRNARGATIHTIEFGIGQHLGDENFLVRLARQHGGQYTYVDVTAP